MARFVGTTSGANYLNLSAGTAGNGAGIAAAGSDSDVDIILSPKGAGGVGIGTAIPTAWPYGETALMVKQRPASSDNIIQAWMDTSDVVRLRVRADSTTAIIDAGDNGVGASGLRLYANNNSPLTLGAHNNSVIINPGPYDANNDYEFRYGGEILTYVDNGTAGNVRTLASRIDLGLYDEATSAGQIRLRPAFDETLQEGVIIRAEADGAARVGIGTDAPDEKLHVYNDANSGAVVKIENPNAGDAALARLDLVGDGGAFSIYRTSTTYGYYFLTPDATYFQDNGGGDMVFLGAAEIMRLKNNGSVGIGTASPTASAILELSTTGKGFLLSRVTTTERDADPRAPRPVFKFTTPRQTGRNSTTATAGRRSVRARAASSAPSTT